MSTNSIIPIGSYDPHLVRAYADLYSEDPSYQKVVHFVKEYDFIGARAAADKIPDLRIQFMAKRLIEVTAENFSTIEELFPFDLP